MQSLRQAALCLHALSKRDQQWLLDALPSRHCASLQGMLRELTLMGIPKDSSLIPTLDGFPLSNDADQYPLDTPERMLADMEAEVVLSHLENESDVVVAILLSVRQWPWSDALCNACPKAANDTAALCVSAIVQRTVMELLVRRIEHAGLAPSSATHGRGY